MCHMRAVHERQPAPHTLATRKCVPRCSPASKFQVSFDQGSTPQKHHSGKGKLRYERHEGWPGQHQAMGRPSHCPAAFFILSVIGH